MQQPLAPIQTASIPQQPQYVPPPQPQFMPPPPQPQYVAPPQQQQRPAAEAPVTARAGGHWDADGGTAVVVAPGDTAETIARRWGVPAPALIQANNITKPTALLPGQKLVIPRYVVGGSGASLAHATNPRTQVAPATVPVAAAPRPQTPPPSAPVSTASAATASVQTLLPTAPLHTVASGETLGKIAGKYRVKPKELALANGIRPDTPLKIGMRLAIPTKVAVASNTQPTKSAPPVMQLAQTTPSSGPSGRSEPTSNMMVATPTDKRSEETNQDGPNGAAGFRWPARGRVINNFGAKVNGATNDGIDLAVPEGTQVRAVDDGVVAYAGNELKGYGNLVLVRHSNGYVSAYANASELMVKRNDQVHKGQVILKSGQTGNAASPQLHFEIRKNSAPVDPMQYLPADRTASAPL